MEGCFEVSNVEFDLKHSIFWKAEDFQLFILKVKERESFVISIMREEKRISASLSGDEFSSLICEVLKYCLDLPEVARAVPCPISCREVQHGCLGVIKSPIKEKNGEFYLELDNWDERFLRYHGHPEEYEFVQTKSGLFLCPVGSKALTERLITELTIEGKARNIKIQTAENPALKLHLIIKKHLLDLIDEAMSKSGLYFNHQEFISSAIRHEVEKNGIQLGEKSGAWQRMARLGNATN